DRGRCAAPSHAFEAASPLEPLNRDVELIEVSADGCEKPFVCARNRRAVGCDHGEYARQAAVGGVVVVVPRLRVLPEVRSCPLGDPVLAGAGVTVDLTGGLLLVWDRLRLSGVGETQTGDDRQESQTDAKHTAEHGRILRSACG